MNTHSEQEESEEGEAAAEREGNRIFCTHSLKTFSVIRNTFCSRYATGFKLMSTLSGVR